MAIGLVLAAGGSPAPTTTPTSSLSAAASATAVVTEPSSSEAAPGDHPPIDGISCDLLEHSAFHIHSHLIVRLGDAQQLVPADIGIHETCLYWVHTHRESGYIHVEAPADTHATLGTFFDIWGQPLTPFQIAEWQAGPGASVFAFVNGEPYEGDPRAIPLTNLVNVELQIALEPLDPLPFTFPDDFL